jgi:hypothetical protein
MKTIKVINLEKDSLIIVESLQKFYGDKAEVSIMEKTDRPQNVDIFFFNAMSMIVDGDIKKLLIELSQINNESKTVAYFEKYEENEVHYSKLRARFGGEGNKLPCDHSICKEYLLKLTWYEKDYLLDLLIPREKFYFVPTPDEDWKEY